MIALVQGYRAGLYARHQWLPNIVAGLVVGIVALPLSMAFAIASGARPEQGIYTAIVGGLIVTLFGWRLRDTLTFDGLEPLLVQMAKDCAQARELTEL